MKKFYPFIFPSIALLIVLFLAWRWYNLRTQRDSEISRLGEGVEIENLTETELDRVMKGAGDFKSVDLTAQEATNAGFVRYELKDGKVTFSVTADLPILETGVYQVWVKAAAQQQPSKAFVLEYGKGGYVGSASVDASNLPLEITVSKELRPDNTIEEVVLTGIIPKE
ncbi:MAG: hypothetical protein GF390_01680 [Candidatus Pacebacteria bacterium]|nr:hypothetical protein [Candidatus Paceibacterota bacterium]